MAFADYKDPVFLYEKYLQAKALTGQAGIRPDYMYLFSGHSFDAKLEALEKELQKCEPDAIKLIVVDSVFSMEGDLANLPEIVRLKKKYNATVYVDEAHGLGVFGRNGRGVCDHFGVTEDIDLIMGTFSKSLASIGGFVAGDKDVINWLRHNARSCLLYTSPSPRDS